MTKLTQTFCLAVSLLFLCVSNAFCIEVPDVQSAALDQPRINMVLQRTADGSFLSYTEGTETHRGITAYFDTGASGILLSKATAYYLGVASSTSGTSTVMYSDIGVGGSDDFHVSEPLYASFAPYSAVFEHEDASAYTQKISSPVRMQIGLTDTELGDEDLDIVGMPAMLGKVVVMDPKPLKNYLAFAADPTLENYNEDMLMHSYIYNRGTAYNSAMPTTDPGIPTTNRTVRLSYGDFSRFTTVTPSGSEGPALTHNPFIGPDPVAKMEGATTDDTPGITISKNGQFVTGSFLLDTGAGASMISTTLAAKLGIRYENGVRDEENPVLEIYNSQTGLYETLTNQFQLTVGGIGGNVTAAGFYLDSLLLPTNEAANPLDAGDWYNLNFTNAPVLVSDITLMDPDDNTKTLTLDGIFGMNYMVASFDASTLGSYSDGVFNWLVFDEAAGTLGLDLDLTSIPEPAALILLSTAAIAFRLRRRLAC